MKFNDIHIGEQIKFILKQSEISQIKLAEIIGTTHSNISRIFTDPDIKLSHLKLISEALNFNFYSLLTSNEYNEIISQYGDYASTIFNSNITNYNGCPVSKTIELFDSINSPAILKETIKSLTNLLSSKQETIDLLKELMIEKS